MTKRPKKVGRPRKRHGPKLSDPEEIERLLVAGELVVGPDGKPTRVWLSQRDVAARYGVAPSLIAEFAKRYRTTERRAALRAKVDAAEASRPSFESGPSPKAAEPTGNEGRTKAGEAPLERSLEPEAQPHSERPTGSAAGLSLERETPTESAETLLEPAALTQSIEPAPERPTGSVGCSPEAEEPGGTIERSPEPEPKEPAGSTEAGLDAAEELDSGSSGERPSMFEEPIAIAESSPMTEEPGSDVEGSAEHEEPLEPIDAASEVETDDARLVELANDWRESDADAEHPTERRKPGRPRHQDAPQFSREELDRLLVFGEVQVLEDGTTTTVYPTYRELADRFGVAVSVVADYAKTRNTMRRRKQTATRIAVRTEEKLIELRSEALAVGEDRLVQMIDEFLLGFESALKEGRVRTDNPADVNTLARLKQFILGGADSRSEVRNILSLESLQERHARIMREMETATPAMTGVIDVRAEIVSETEQPKPNAEGRVRLASPRSVSEGGEAPPLSTVDSDREPNVSHELLAEVGALVGLVRELAEAAGNDDAELRQRALGVAARVEAHLPPRDGADVGPRGASAEEDEA